MPILALNPRGQGSEVAVFFPTPLTLPKTLTTRSEFYFSDTAMNSEWSSLVRVYSFQRVFQLVWGKEALCGQSPQLWSALGKAGWQLVGAALRVATSWVPSRMLPISIYHLTELREDRLSIPTDNCRTDYRRSLPIWFPIMSRTRSAKAVRLMGLTNYMRAWGHWGSHVILQPRSSFAGALSCLPRKKKKHVPWVPQVAGRFTWPYGCPTASSLPMRPRLSSSWCWKAHSP